MSDKVKVRSLKTQKVQSLSKEDAKVHMELHPRKFVIEGNEELFTPKEINAMRKTEQAETKTAKNKAVAGAVTNVGPQVADVAGENTSV